MMYFAMDIDTNIKGISYLQMPENWPAKLCRTVYSYEERCNVGKLRSIV